jgi:hypothetical protein
MRRILFSLCCSLIPFFLGIFLPYVPLPGGLRLANLFWDVVYGAGLWAIDWLVGFHPLSRVSLSWIFGWPIAVSFVLFFIGRNLYETHPRLRFWSICTLIASALFVTRADRLLEPPFSHLPTFHGIFFAIY